MLIVGPGVGGEKIGVVEPEPGEGRGLGECENGVPEIVVLGARRNARMQQ